jgi:hypothetical protein
VKLALRDNPLNEYTVSGHLPSRLLGLLLFFIPYTSVSFPTSSYGKVKIWRSMSVLVSLLQLQNIGLLYLICIFSFLGNVVHPLFFGGCMIDALRMSKLMQCKSLLICT